MPGHGIMATMLDTPESAAPPSSDRPTTPGPAGVIELVGVTKTFGPVRALDQFSMRVERGECFGFIGANGAGKSTTMRVLVDLVRPDSGSVRVLDVDPRRDGPRLRERIGYLPGEPSLPGTRTSRGYLTHLAALRGDRGRLDIEPLAERFSLDLDRRMGKLSKGNRQKVVLIQALMGNPELLLLDEPTSGLDPLLQREFHDVLSEAIHGGATALVSSHVLREIEGVADRVGIIRAGVMVDVGSVAAIRHRAGQRFEIRIDGPADAQDFARVDGVEPSSVEVRPDGAHGTSVQLLVRGSPDALVKHLSAFTTTELIAGYEELEDLVVDLYRDEPR